MESKVERKSNYVSPCKSTNPVVIYHEVMQNYIGYENFARTRTPDRNKMALYDYRRLDG